MLLTTATEPTRESRSCESSRPLLNCPRDGRNVTWPAWLMLWRLASWIFFACWLIPGNDLSAQDDKSRFFENEIRPTFVDECSRCHGSEKQSGGLRVDSIEALLQGGDSGAAIVAGDVQQSLLLRAVKRDDELKMPPDKPLSSRQIAALSQWVEHGAVWPKSSVTQVEAARNSKNHWAFQRVGEHQIPVVENPSWLRNPIDAFVFSKLRQHGIAPSPEADRATLIRRAYYTLTGVPPTFDEVDAFVHDDRPDAYELLVDRLLESQSFGEHWARQWLDVARYADTKGYVYAREERFWVHAWTYRDWVVNAFNEDLPYDRFVLLQIAADKIHDKREVDLAAMGFLTLGRRFLGVKHDIIDDRIDVVTRGTMGLTVSCARCHDHKYDPIPTADYYSLYGIFDSSLERVVALNTKQPPSDEFQRELKVRQDKLQARMSESIGEASARARARIGDYLKAQTELEKYPADGFDQAFSKDDILPSFVRQWQEFLRRADPLNERVFSAWRAFAMLDRSAFAREAATVAEQVRNSQDRWNPLVARSFSAPPNGLDEVIERYASLFRDVDQRWQEALATAQARHEPPPDGLPDAASEELRQVLYGERSPCRVPDETIVHCETFFDLKTVEELWKLQGEVDRWIINSKEAVPCSLTLVDRPFPQEPRIFRRGNPLQKTDLVPRQFPELLAGERRHAFRNGSGRLELAQAIVDPANPLTARVIVNRLWARHFGQGLVPTTSDFGVRAEAPSHPELLDWLASRLVADRWSLKKLHRMIVASAAFRQSSGDPLDAASRDRCAQLDPRNRWLWRMNRKRLTFEEFRDSMLVAARQIDWSVGGKPVDLFAKPFPRRRTLYGLVDRQFLPSTLRTFDFANPDLHIPTRTETTVPQQSLYLLNHPIVLDQARQLARLASTVPSQTETARRLFEFALHRAPSPEEVEDALAFVGSIETTEKSRESPTASEWRYGYGKLDEKSGNVVEFKELPYFSGTAWQGGEKWPDAKLGWVQLTAKGGHPGNDLEHAAVRRWTAPRSMLISIRSELVHDAAPGDGVRASIVSSMGGTLRTATAHQNKATLDVDSLQVAQGQSVDFLVDIGKVLNSDQFQWTATITKQGPEAIEWNSHSDFTVSRVPVLSAWEQLAHVLLCMNEFSFVD